MSGFVDTHAHIYLEEFDPDQEEVLNRSKEAGVEKILMPNIDTTSFKRMNLLAEKYSDRCFPMMGLHPCSVNEDFEPDLKFVEQQLSEKKYYAVGEIGTDLYWEKKFWEQQKIAFKFQCALAVKFALPVVIHCRESLEETIEMLEMENNPNLTGVFHCFSGTVQQARRIISLGFFMGIGGVATFKNGGLDKVLPEIGLANLVLETDSPYLAPVPYRGKRNEPSYIPLIAERVGSLCGSTLDEVRDVTTKNAHQIFKL